LNAHPLKRLEGPEALTLAGGPQATRVSTIQSEPDR
jgi:hypothetical protein